MSIFDGYIPVMIDLACGLGGVTKAFQDKGYRTIGFDVELVDYPGELVIQDIRTLDGFALKGADVIWASPPCQEFSRHDQPWTRAKNPPPPDLSIVEACYRIKDQAQPRIFILENVRGAQKWLGKSVLTRRGVYLWGDVPPLSKMEGDILGKSKQQFSGSQPRERAEVPFILASQVADWCKLSLRKGAR